MSNRRWPADLEKQLFIKRPHAVEQYRERAQLPSNYNFERAEEDLRTAICEAMRAGKMHRNTRLRGNPDTEFVVRVAPAGFEVVYALIEKGAANGNYPYMCHTVFDQRMFQQWNEEGKIATMRDLPSAAALNDVPVPPEPDPDDYGRGLLLVHVTPDGVALHEADEQNLQRLIGHLMSEGCNFSNIRLFKEIPFKLTIKLGEE
jgi:hypothetical protein